MRFYLSVVLNVLLLVVEQTLAADVSTNPLVYHASVSRESMTERQICKHSFLAFKNG